MSVHQPREVHQGHSRSSRSVDDMRSEARGGDDDIECQHAVDSGKVKMSVHQSQIVHQGCPQAGGDQRS